MADSNQTDAASTMYGKDLSLSTDDSTGSTCLRYRSNQQDVRWSVIDDRKIVGFSRREDSALLELLYLATDDGVEKPDATHVLLRSAKFEDTSYDVLEHLSNLSGLATSSYLGHLVTTQASGISFHIIISTKSGTGLAEGFFETVLRAFLQRVLPRQKYHVHVTTSDQSIIELSRHEFLPAAQAGREQAIILLSGDGGMIDVLNALQEQPHSTTYRAPNVAVLSFGTGNALANSASKPEDDTFGLRSLYNGSPQPLPAFRATFSPGARYVINEGQDEVQLRLVEEQPTTYGAVVCSWGFHASLVADSDTVEYRKHGAERFQMAAKEALFPNDGSSPHPYRGTVKVSSRTEAGPDEWTEIGKDEHSYVLATLVSQLEAGFTINPSYTPLDAKLRLIHLGPLPGAEIMEIMQKAYQGGTHVRDERVEYRDIDGLRIGFNEDDPRWRRVCIDGKIIRVEKNGWVEVRTDVEPSVNLITSYA